MLSPLYIGHILYLDWPTLVKALQINGMHFCVVSFISGLELMNLIIIKNLTITLSKKEQYRHKMKSYMTSLKTWLHIFHTKA